MDTVTETGRTAIAGLAAVDDASVVADAVVEAGRTAIAFETAIGDKITARTRSATGGRWRRRTMAPPLHTALIGHAAALSPGVIARPGQRHA